jgi:hypothetical protein
MIEPVFFKDKEKVLELIEVLKLMAKDEEAIKDIVSTGEYKTKIDNGGLPYRYLIGTRIGIDMVKYAGFDRGTVGLEISNKYIKKTDSTYGPYGVEKKFKDFHEKFDSNYMPESIGILAVCEILYSLIDEIWDLEMNEIEKKEKLYFIKTLEKYKTNGN